MTAIIELKSILHRSANTLTITLPLQPIGVFRVLQS